MSIISQWQKQLNQSKGLKLQASFVITTPMFIGDGNQKADSVRPPSIKGALRFWWRALFWHHFMAQNQNDESSALTNMHEAEGDLFGLAASDQAGGQARFSIVVSQFKKKQQNGGWSPKTGAKYLLGQGGPAGGSGRYITAGSSFSLTLEGKPGPTGPTNDQWQELEKALLLWGLLGGLGSRGRKGIGSVSLQSIAGGDIPVPLNKAEYFFLLKGLLAPTRSLNTTPPFTALSAHLRLGCCIEGTNPLELLNTLGDGMRLYRSGGDNPRPGNRSVFGLPHDDFYTTKKSQRRASPLFSHIHQFPSGDALAMQLLIPAQFLPTSEGIDVKKIDWKVIHRYLDKQFNSQNTLFDAMESLNEKS